MRKAFTLIEILIVVAIIAILATVVLIGLGPVQQSGRDARRLSDLREAMNGIGLYFQKCDFYPGTINCGSAASPTPDAAGWANLSGAIVGSGIGVANPLPMDPSSPGRYYFYSNFPLGVGSSYTIGAKLENQNNAVFTNYAPPANVPNGHTCLRPEWCASL